MNYEFFWVILLWFLNGLELSIKLCAFDISTEFFPTIVSPLLHFKNLWSQTPPKWLKKGKTVFHNCLRFKIGINFRINILHFIKKKIKVTATLLCISSRKGSWKRKALETKYGLASVQFNLVSNFEMKFVCYFSKSVQCYSIDIRLVWRQLDRSTCL